MAWTRFQPVGAAPNKLPCSLRQQVGLAIPAAEQEEQGLFGERLHGPLLEPRRYQVGVAGVGYDGIAAQPELPAGATMRLHQLPNESR